MTRTQSGSGAIASASARLPPNIWRRPSTPFVAAGFNIACVDRTTYHIGVIAPLHTAHGFNSDNFKVLLAF
jgi:hypothetical protein